MGITEPIRASQARILVRFRRSTDSMSAAVFNFGAHLQCCNRAQLADDLERRRVVYGCHDWGTTLVVASCNLHGVFHEFQTHMNDCLNTAATSI